MEVKPKYCMDCGMPLVPGKKFCGECGTPINGVKASAPAPVIKPKRATFTPVIAGEDGDDDDYSNASLRRIDQANSLEELGLGSLRGLDVEFLEAPQRRETLKDVFESPAGSRGDARILSNFSDAENLQALKQDSAPAKRIS